MVKNIEIEEEKEIELTDESITSDGEIINPFQQKI